MSQVLSSIYYIYFL